MTPEEAVRREAAEAKKRGAIRNLGIWTLLVGCLGGVCGMVLAAVAVDSAPPRILLTTGARGVVLGSAGLLAGLFAATCYVLICFCFAAAEALDAEHGE